MESGFRVMDPFVAIRTIVKSSDQFCVFLGAGTSIEAGVPTADMICTEIAEEMIIEENNRRSLQTQLKLLETESAKKRWLNRAVNWADEENRYSYLIKHWHQQQTTRVDFFRDLLKGKNPSFVHYALALLIQNGYLSRTCITTNFDKLLEKAFSEINDIECQAIRMAEEAQYWKKEDDKCYLFKLHGDYDTHNILNTNDETTLIKETMIQNVENLLYHSGLLMIGCAGREKSIHTLLDRLTTKENLAKGILDYGILWGVYVGNRPPKNFNKSTIEKAVEQSIKDGAVGKEIVKLMKRLSTTSETLFGFFPVWGSGKFLRDFINLTENEMLIKLSEPFLDHTIRVTEVFKRAGLSDAACNRHLKQLKLQKEKISRSTSEEKPEEITKYKCSNGINISAAYGDISSEAMLNYFSKNSEIRGIVSPEDTCLSVGGGAALAIGEKSGLRNILFELAKFSPIPLCDNVVSSGGRLSVHYIIHAAGVEITENGAKTSDENIKKTTLNIINRAQALGIEYLWIPLLGAGVAGIKPQTSLEQIFTAIKEYPTLANNKKELSIILAILNAKIMDRVTIKKIFEKLSKNP